MGTNEFLRFKMIAEVTNEELAHELEIDIAQLQLMERGHDFISLNTAFNLAISLDCSMADLFPPLKPLTLVEKDPDTGEMIKVPDGEDELDGDDLIRIAASDEQNLHYFYDAGIDPLGNQYLIVNFKSGIERRYRLSSYEKTKILDQLTGDLEGRRYLVFLADCQTVILRISSIVSVKSTSHASYAPFSSSERAVTAVIVCPPYPRPMMTEMEPDDENDRPVLNLIEQARAGEIKPGFFRLGHENEIQLLNINEMDAIEIPLGVIIPDLYEEYQSTPIDANEVLWLNMPLAGSA